MGPLANLVLLLGFAWLVRGLLSAHEVTWPGAFLAVFIGSVLGTATAVLLVVSPAELVGIDADDLPRAELLLATRPDLLPPAAMAELGRFHAGARPLPREEIMAALQRELDSPPESLFTEFSWTPLGSASIAQVHAARLADGTEVVLELRRPGLEEVVERDLAIVRWLARLAERRTSWGRRRHRPGRGVRGRTAGRTRSARRSQAWKRGRRCAGRRRPDHRAPGLHRARDGTSPGDGTLARPGVVPAHNTAAR